MCEKCDAKVKEMFYFLQDNAMKYREEKGLDWNVVLDALYYLYVSLEKELAEREEKPPTENIFNENDIEQIFNMLIMNTKKEELN